MEPSFRYDMLLIGLVFLLKLASKQVGFVLMDIVKQITAYFPLLIPKVALLKFMDCVLDFQI